MHPKTRTDMDRRIDALAASPIRTARPEFPPPMSAAIKSSPVSPDAQKQTPLVPSSTSAGLTRALCLRSITRT